MTSFTRRMIALCALLQVAAAAAAAPSHPSDPVIVVPASLELGFGFPYVLYVPDAAQAGDSYLVVECNNSGVSDDFSVHLLGAIAAADGSTNSIGHFVAKQLGFPLLVPAFPRPKARWWVYTHALDRDTMRIEKGDLKRLDLQLIAMVRDAQQRLTRQGMHLQQRILMNGFSASGSFTNRFTFLHPEIVQAAAYGGINGILMLPLTELGGRRLDYPLGIHDLGSITGQGFDLDTYRRIPQFAYMGAEDGNDAVLYDDAYSDSERRTVYEVLGKRMQPDRWQKCQAIYAEQRIQATFETYAGIGHGTNGAINREVAGFFRRSVQP